MPREKTGEKVYTYSARRLVYALCFFFFCIIEQRTKTCSGLDGWQETFRDLTGVVMAVLLFSHWRWEDVKRRKAPYLVWTVLWAVCMPFAFRWGKENRPFLNDWAVVLLDVVLYGYLLLHLFLQVVLEKKRPRLNKKFFAAWLVLMALAIVSRSTYIWPFCYLVMFGCFYLTDYTGQEREDLFQGMLDGIILGFFVLQGLCFVFRPYDIVRYCGYFANPNWNALFYVEVLAAVLAKILSVTKNGSSKWARVYYWLGAGVVLSFELMTIGRSGWLTAIVLLFAFFRFLKKIQPRVRFWKKLALTAACVLFTFPLCFGAVRYLPPLFHHPMWFWGEWSEQRVHSWDPWDSEKYVDLDEYLESALGRIFDSFTNLLEHSPLQAKAQASEAAGKQEDSQHERLQQRNLPPNRIPVLSDDVSQRDTILIRRTIYGYYLRRLNLWGHPYEEQGFQLQKNYWIGHAHNIYLQYGTDFGIPFMLLFTGLIAVGAFLLGRQFARTGSVEAAACWMFLLIPAVFGIFEYAWGVGSLSITMLFTAWRKAVVSGEE